MNKRAVAMNLEIDKIEQEPYILWAFDEKANFFLMNIAQSAGNKAPAQFADGAHERDYSG